MKKSYRLLGALLALLMSVSCFAACGESGENDENKEDGSTTEAETKNETQEALDAVGEVNWGGADFTILYTNDIAGYTSEVFAESYAIGDGSASAVINDAVFERNTLFAERCKLQLKLVGRGSGAVMSAVSSENISGAGDYQFFTLPTSHAASLATGGQLYNYLNMDIDYEAAWWDQGTLEFALDGKVFFMNGAHNFVDDDVTFVMMFNKKLYSDHGLEDLYTVVKNKEWTLDLFKSLIQGISAENGDGKWDENDTYGFCSPNTIGNTFFYGAGLQYIINNRDMAVPELALDEGKLTKATDLLEKVREITLANNSSFIAPGGKEGLASDMFKDNRSLFYVEAASYLGGLNRSMDGDYGVIPIPKYDKAQEEYLTWTHSIGSTLVMPISIKNTEELPGVVETYVILSYMKVTPAYYDTMLTKRNIRDAESAEMLDIIFRNRVYDMAMYFTQLNLHELFSQAALKSSSNFASGYTKATRSFDRQIRKIMANLSKLDQ